MPLSKKVAAELIGTFWLVLGGCGSAVLAAKFPEVGIGFVGVALAFGLTVLTMAYAVGHISGAPPSRLASLPAAAPRPANCCPISSRKWPARSSPAPSST
jgi:aquaporin Z